MGEPEKSALTSIIQQDFVIFKDLHTCTTPGICCPQAARQGNSRGRHPGFLTTHQTRSQRQLQSIHAVVLQQIGGELSATKENQVEHSCFPQGD